MHVRLCLKQQWNMLLMLSVIKTLSNQMAMKILNQAILFMALIMYMLFYLFYIKLFLFHGFSPDTMILDTMILIPKDKSRSISTSSNYKTITLGNHFS